MRTCVVFNPTAKGNKARRFRKHLDEFGSRCALKLTQAVGDARRLAGEAVREGFEVVVAAGGDGTVNEVLNGLGDVSDGFARTRLGVLPLGTVNVFARELGLPLSLGAAWKTLMEGAETRIDLPSVTYQTAAGKEQRWFVQLAGAGLDARAVELVSWPLKKKVGPLAYIWAGLQAVASRQPQITVTAGQRVDQGPLVVIGNGRLYGGDYRVFPQADLRDGLLEVCVLPRVNWFVLARCGPTMLLRGALPRGYTRAFQADSLQLSGEAGIPFQLDGELVGRLPATFSVQRDALRVCVPNASQTR